MRNAWSSNVEEQVTEIWNSVLEVAEGEDGATFCELGGRAISAVRIVARIHDSLGIRVEPGELFKDPALDAFLSAVLVQAKPARQ
ncbi:phosphopantetheine-binding protein [Streptosporangium sp. KLBMP 9127]|nr:phosphopantetheine-binding protein [Streptosporangium sp. KLBMP 9127]